MGRVRSDFRFLPRCSLWELMKPANEIIDVYCFVHFTEDFESFSVVRDSILWYHTYNMLW